MDTFSPIVLFSQVQGQVLQNGQPAVGAELVQKAVWSDDESKNPTRTTTTDKQGRFSFSAMTAKPGLRRLIPAQPMVLQSIVIRYEGNEYVAWKHGKNTYKPNSELDGRPLDLTCFVSSVSA